MQAPVRDRPRQPLEPLRRFWQAPERLALARIVSVALSALAVLFLLDSGLFRTGFYLNYLEPDSSAGDFENILEMARQKQFHRPHRALVLGDSQIAEGFSMRAADEEGAAAGWEFLNAAAAGSSMRTWYYLIRDIDPDRSHFDSIILPLRTYADVDDGDSRADREIDIRWMIGRLRLSDISQFAASFPSRAIRTRILTESLFEGLVYRRDLREFLRNPALRLRHLQDCRAACLDSYYSYPGRPESLSGVRVDWTSNPVQFSPNLSPELRDEIQAQAGFQTWSVHGPERRFREEWLGRILERYRGKPTRFIIIGVPRSPFPIPRSWPVDRNSFISAASRNPQVTILDERLFHDLEQPDLFFDLLHLNAKGRDLFSRRLTAALIERAGGQSRR